MYTVTIITNKGFGMEILTSEGLLKEQLSKVGTRKKTKAVDLPKQIGISYNVELKRIINQVRVDIERQIVPEVKYLEPQYTADGWSDNIMNAISRVRRLYQSGRFDDLAKQLARKFVSDIDTYNQRKLDSQFRSFGINVFGSNAAVQDYLEASIADNVRLIKSIPEQYLDRVESSVMSNMRAGLRPSAIVKSLQDDFGVTQNRAKMIARDQTSKAANGLASKCMQASGVEYFQWADSDDERVRSRHRRIANKITAYGKGIYRWDNLPLSDKGIPIAPGDDYQCRCTARPVLKSEVLRNQKEGKVAKGVYR